LLAHYHTDPGSLRHAHAVVSRAVSRELIGKKTYEERDAAWYGSNEHQDIPLMREIAKNIDDIGLAELGLNEIYNVKEVSLAAVLAVDDPGLGGEKQDVALTRLTAHFHAII
jgi:hypothetical protein